MKVSQYMTANPVTVAPEMGARSTFFMMLSNGIRHLPVVQDRKLVGFISDRDLRRPNWVDEAGDISYPYALNDEMQVRDLMSDKVTTLKAGDHIGKAVRIFERHRYGAIPVLDKRGDLIGVLSVYDLLEPMGELIEEAKKNKRANRG